LNDFTYTLPGIFLVPALPFYLFWSQGTIIGCFFTCCRAYFSHSAKNKKFLAAARVFKFFKERLSVYGLSGFPRNILHKTGNMQSPFFTGRASASSNYILSIILY
jgi:hypothetical protein